MGRPPAAGGAALTAGEEQFEDYRVDLDRGGRGMAGHPVREDIRLLDLGAAVGRGQPAVSDWEGDLTYPESEVVVQLEHELGVPPGHLSRALGYMPVGPPSTDLVAAIEDSDEIDDDGRALLLLIVNHLRRSPARTVRRSSLPA